jgi:hypothetical protein
MTIGMRWFPHRKGMAMGVVVGGFGGGAFVFNQIQVGKIAVFILTLAKRSMLTLITTASCLFIISTAQMRGL